MRSNVRNGFAHLPRENAKLHTHTHTRLTIPGKPFSFSYECRRWPLFTFYIFRYTFECPATALHSTLEQVTKLRSSSSMLKCSHFRFASPAAACNRQVSRVHLICTCCTRTNQNCFRSRYVHNGTLLAQLLGSHRELGATQILQSGTVTVCLQENRIRSMYDWREAVERVRLSAGRAHLVFFIGVASSSVVVFCSVRAGL